MSLTKEDVFKKVASVAKEHLEIESEELEMSTKFEELDVDSLDIVEMTMALEEEFSVEIPDELLENIEKIEDIVNHIQENA